MNFCLIEYTADMQHPAGLPLPLLGREGTHAFHVHQMQLMLLEQQNRKKLLMSSQQPKKRRIKHFCSNGRRDRCLSANWDNSYH